MYFYCDFVILFLSISDDLLNGARDGATRAWEFLG